MSTRRRPPYRSRTSYSLVAVALGVGLFALLALLTPLTPYLAWLAAWSVVAFGFFGYDKAQAQQQGWRVPEMVLHGLSLVGGFAGALAGMLVFRHKTRHGIFWLVVALSALLYLALRPYLG